MPPCTNDNGASTYVIFYRIKESSPQVFILNDTGGQQCILPAIPDRNTQRTDLEIAIAALRHILPDGKMPDIAQIHEFQPGAGERRLLFCSTKQNLPETYRGEYVSHNCLALLNGFCENCCRIAVNLAGIMGDFCKTTKHQTRIRLVYQGS